MYKKILKNLWRTLGFEAVFHKLICPDIVADKKFIAEYGKCQNYTMTSIERMYSLYRAVEHVVVNKVPGDMVECGVWRGGSAMLIARALIGLRETQRKIYLYDTYTGMTEPGEVDVRFDDKPAKKTWSNNIDAKKGVNKWCYAPLEEVKNNLRSTGYPEEKLVFVQGDIKKTLPDVFPDKIAVLRLDTDWYDLTYHELRHLFSRLSRSGIIIIDDYGHWKGVKQAVDQYFKENDIPILLHRIDYSGRLAVKS